MANLNEILGNVKEKVAQGAQAASQKAQDLTAIAKANLAIKSEQGKIRKAHIELGKLYYADHTAGNAPGGEAYDPWCEKITESQKAIEEQKAIIEALKAKKDEPSGEDPEVVVELTEDDLVEEKGSEETASEEDDDEDDDE